MPTDNGGRSPVSPPPEGVLAGEDVPRENETDDLTDSMIETAENELQGRGEPYRSMSSSELRERAISLLRKTGMEVA